MYCYIYTDCLNYHFFFWYVRRIAGEEGGKDSTSSEYEALLVWVDQAQALMDAPVNVTDEATLSAHSTMIQVSFNVLLKKEKIITFNKYNLFLYYYFIVIYQASTICIFRW